MSEESKKPVGAETPAAKPATPAAPAAKKARVWFKDPKTGKVTERK